MQIQNYKDDWIKVMLDEIASLRKNNTFEFIELPKGRKALNISGYSN